MIYYRTYTFINSLGNTIKSKVKSKTQIWWYTLLCYSFDNNNIQRRPFFSQLWTLSMHERFNLNKTSVKYSKSDGNNPIGFFFSLHVRIKSDRIFVQNRIRRKTDMKKRFLIKYKNRINSDPNSDERKPRLNHTFLPIPIENWVDITLHNATRPQFSLQKRKIWLRS